MNENKIIVAGDALSTIKDVSLGLAILLSNCDMDSFPELKALHNGLLNMHSEAKGALNKLDDE